MIKAAIFSYHPAPYRDPAFEAFHRRYRNEIEYKVYFARSVDLGHTYQKLDSLECNNFILNLQIEPPYNVVSYSKNYRVISNILKDHVYDVVLIPGHSDTFNLPIIHYCIMHGIPYVLSSDSISLNKNSRLRNTIKLLADRFFVGHAASLFIPGRASKEFCIKMGADKQSIFEGAYCLDAKRLYEEAEEIRPNRDAVRQSLGVEEDDFLLLYAGRFIDVSDFDTMLHSYAKARENNSKIRLLLIGDGPEKQRIERYIKEESIDGIVIHDFVPIHEIAKYYISSDAYIMTNIWGNYGLAVVQSAICGLPIISTNTLGSAFDVVVDAQSGFITPIKSVDESSKAILKLASLDSETLRHMGSVGRKLAMERTPEWAAENLYSALKAAASKKNKRSERNDTTC